MNVPHKEGEQSSPRAQARLSLSSRYHMALHLERTPLTSARKANKVLHLCRKFQLKELGISLCYFPPTLPPPSLSVLSGESVCRVMAMKEFRAGRLGASFSWCLQSRDSVFAAFLAEKCTLSSPPLSWCESVCHLSAGISLVTRHWASSWTLTSSTTSELPCSSPRNSHFSVSSPYPPFGLQ